MVQSLDMALDDIISTKPKRRQGRSVGRRGSARAQVLGTAPVVSPAARARARVRGRAVAAPPATPQTTPADKIIVSNLPQDVNETQIKELFHSTVGPLRLVTLHFDSAGRSKGVAAIQFQKAGDGNRAYTQYNNRLIDGKRPMKIEIVVDPSRPPPLAQRVAPAVTAAAAPVNGKSPKTGGGRRHKRGIRARKADRPVASLATLDAEMEDYTTSNAQAVTA